MIDRREFLRDLERLSKQLRRRIEAEVDGFAPDRESKEKRRAKSTSDFRYFARTYFPHYLSRGESLVHRWIFNQLPKIVDAKESRQMALAAPRGEAKSTLVSLIFVIWCVLTGRKRYIMIAMDTFDQAAVMLESIRAELEVNPRLLSDFEDGTGVGEVWNAGVMVTRGNAKIEAVGSGKRIRGRRHGPWRPDLFIGDDLENDENVRTPAQRDKLQGWISKAVLKLGGAGEKFDVIIVGTVLHYDSVLARLLKNPLWCGNRFRALIRPPDRMDLWDRWEAVLKSEGEAAARAFYQARRKKMEAGAKVSWPEARPLYELMTIRARDGHAAFDSELQNEPVSLEDAPFARCLHYWTELPEGMISYGAVDPSLGIKGAGRDPSAILVGGFEPLSGVLYVLAADIRRRTPDRIIEDVIALQIRHGCLLWAVEAVQFQEFLRTELMKRGAARGVPVPARAVKPIADKQLRIEALQPHMEAGQILLHPSQTTLTEQLLHFPKADHDDGPDALQMLWMLAASGNRRTHEGVRLKWL